MKVLETQTVTTCFTPMLFLPFSENRIEQFGRFIKNMDESVKAIQDRGQVHCEKCQGCEFCLQALISPIMLRQNQNVS